MKYKEMVGDRDDCDDWDDSDIEYTVVEGGREVALTRAALRRSCISNEAHNVFYVSFEVERAESRRGAVKTRRREGYTERERERWRVKII